MSNKTKIIGIYKIINRVNNKIYIGQSVDINYRLYIHKRNVKKNKRHPLYASMRKHDIENFEFIIIEQVHDIGKLDEREQYWINHYKSNDKNYGYNLRLECTTNRGCKYSEESRKNSENKRLVTIEYKKSANSEYIIAILEKRKQTRIKNGTTKVYSIDKDEVIRLYIDENYRLKDVAKTMNLSFGLLAKFLKLNNIKKRKLNVDKVKSIITDEQLHNLCDSSYSNV